MHFYRSDVSRCERSVEPCAFMQGSTSQRVRPPASLRVRMPLSLWMWACVCASVCVWMSTSAHAQENTFHPWHDKENDGHRPHLCVVSILEDSPTEGQAWDSFLKEQAAHYYQEAHHRSVSSQHFTKEALLSALTETFKHCEHPTDQRMLLAHVRVLEEESSGLQYLVPERDGKVVGEPGDWAETFQLLNDLFKDPSSNTSTLELDAKAVRPLLMLIESKQASGENTTSPGFKQVSLKPLDTWLLNHKGAATLLAPKEPSDGTFLQTVLELARGEKGDIPPRWDVDMKDFESKKASSKPTQEETQEKRIKEASEHHGLLSFEELLWLYRETKAGADLLQSKVGSSFEDLPLFWMPAYLKKRQEEKQLVCNGFSEYEHEAWKRELDKDKDGELPTSICPTLRYGKEYATDCNDQDHDMKKYTYAGEKRQHNGEIFGDLKDNNCNDMIDEYKNPKHKNAEQASEGNAEQASERNVQPKDYVMALDWDALEKRGACLTRRQVMYGTMASVALALATTQMFTQILPVRSCAVAEAGAFPTLCSSGVVNEDITPAVLQARSIQAASAFAISGVGASMTIVFGVNQYQLRNQLRSTGKQEDHALERKGYAPTEAGRKRYDGLPFCNRSVDVIPGIRAFSVDAIPRIPARLWPKSAGSN